MTERASKRRRLYANDAESESISGNTTQNSSFPLPDELMVGILQNLPFMCAWRFLSTCRRMRFTVAARKDVSNLCIDLAYKTVFGPFLRNERKTCEILFLGTDASQPTAAEYFKALAHSRIRISLMCEVTHSSVHALPSTMISIVPVAEQEPEYTWNPADDRCRIMECGPFRNIFSAMRIHWHLLESIPRIEPLLKKDHFMMETSNPYTAMSERTTRWHRAWCLATSERQSGVIMCIMDSEQVQYRWPPHIGSHPSVERQEVGFREGVIKRLHFYDKEAVSRLRAKLDEHVRDSELFFGASLFIKNTGQPV